MTKKKNLKNIKKNKDVNETKNEKDTFFKFITTLVVLLLIFILVYFLIGLFYTKEINFKSDDKKSNKEEIDIDNSTITLGQLFDQAEDEYYVLIHDVNDKKSIIPTWMQVFLNNNSTSTIYEVDSKNKFNSNYIVDSNSNTNPSSYSDLKVKSPTLIKIKNKIVSEYIEGEDSIKDYFKNN